MAVTLHDVRSELVPLEEHVPIGHLTWTKRSLSPAAFEGYIGVCVPEQRAHLFPSRLRLFGKPVTIHRVLNEPAIVSCERCFGFHNARQCLRPCLCESCGQRKHEGGFERAERYRNCYGPHKSTYPKCPARPTIKGGRVVWLTREERLAVRSVGGAEYARKHVENP